MFRYFKIIFFLSILLSQHSLAQNTIQFAEGNLEAAFERSKTEQKPVCLLCYASWCLHCANMRETVFIKPDVAYFYNQHFICVEQDMEKDEGVELHSKFAIKSYPTILFFGKNQTVIYRIEGEFSSLNFIQEGKNALMPERQLPILKSKFESDVSNSDACYEYLRALKKGGIDYSDVVKAYFLTQTDKQLLSELNWRIIANGVNDLNSREFRFVLAHQREFSSIASPERVQKKIFYLAKTILTPLAEKNDTTNYRINKTQLAMIHNYQVDSLIFSYDVTLTKYNEKWDDFKIVTLLSTDKYAWNDYNQLKEIAEAYQKNIYDKQALMQAIKWINRSLSLTAEYKTFLVGARLYQKLKDISNALLMTNNAEKEAAKFGWNHDEADQLLKELESNINN
jgi:thioredoxin-related protein